MKLIATGLSGGFMGLAGAPLPYYVTYLDPASGFNLNYAVNAIAMPLIGGTGSWAGPVIGAVLVGGHHVDHVEVNQNGTSLPRYTGHRSLRS